MWALGYIIMWIIAIWAVGCGFLMVTVASQFQKELGWIGIIMMLLGGAGGWKLSTMINISVAIT